MTQPKYIQFIFNNVLTGLCKRQMNLLHKYCTVLDLFGSKQTIYHGKKLPNSMWHIPDRAINNWPPMDKNAHEYDPTNVQLWCHIQKQDGAISIVQEKSRPVEEKHTSPWYPLLDHTCSCILLISSHMVYFFTYQHLKQLAFYKHILTKIQI